MKNFTQPLFLKIESQAQLDTLALAIEGTLEMHDDTLLDEVPYRATQIREMAGMSDENLKEALKKIHDITNENIDTVNHLRDITKNLQRVIDDNNS